MGGVGTLYGQWQGLKYRNQYLAGLAPTWDSPKPDNPLVDSKPTTLAERGAVLPLVIGRQMVGPIALWAGERKTRTEETSSGSGGKGTSGGTGDTEQKIWFESGMHGICIGPGFRLLRIWEDGKILWPAPGEYVDGISWDNTGTKVRSGDSFVCNDEGGDGYPSSHKSRFRLYFGEPDQPVDPLIATEYGISSRWPYMMWVMWDEKRLGGFPRWGSLEYEVEVRPYRAGMTYAASVAGTEWDTLAAPLGTPAEAGSGWLANGVAVNELACYTPMLLSGNTIHICGTLTSVFQAGSKLRVKDGELKVFDATVISSSNGVSSTHVFEPERHQRDLGLFSFNATLTNCDISLSSSPTEDAPPGAVIGSGYTLARLTRNNSNGQRARMNVSPFSARSYDPDGAADKFQFGLGRNVATVYMHEDNQGIVNGTLFGLGFSDASTDDPPKHYARFVFRTGPNRFEVFDENNGAQAELTELSGGWWELRAHYDTGEGGIPSSETDDFFCSVFMSSSTTLNDYIEFVQGRVGGESPEFLVAAPVASMVEFYEWTTCALGTEIIIDVDSGLSYEDEAIPLQVCALEENAELGPQGANAGHLLYQLFFESFPHGTGNTNDDIDYASLQAVALALSESGEGLRSHAYLKDGIDFAAFLDSVFTDLGLVMAWDITQGKYTFKLLREGDSPIVLDSPLHSDDDPEVDRRLPGGQLPRLVFGFNNWELRYREDDVIIPDFGIIINASTQARNRKKLTVPRDFEAAASIAERRSAEDFASPIPFTFTASREAALLRPGDLLDLSAAATDQDYPSLIENPVRVLGTKLDVKSGRATLTCAVDSYSIAPPTSIASVYGGGNSAGGVVVPSLVDVDSLPISYDDHQQRVFELPGLFSAGIGMIFLRVSGDNQQTGAALILSDDGTTYLQSAAPATAAVGGKSLGEFNSDYVEIGLADPTNTIARRHEVEYGPAFLSPTDSPAFLPVLDEAQWHAGKLVMLIGQEMMLIREVVPVGGNVYQPRGIIRGAFGTEISDHDVNSEVYILQRSSLVAASDAILAKGAPSYAKMLVQAQSSVQPAGLAPAISFTPTGRALRPFDPMNVRNREMNFAFSSGADVEILWDYRLHQGLTRRSGSGFQGYGEATNPFGDLQGTFKVVILDSTGTNIKRTVSGLTSPTYTYSSVDRVSDFGAEASFRADIQFIGDDADASGRDFAVFQLI